MTKAGTYSKGFVMFIPTIKKEIININTKNPIIKIIADNSALLSVRLLRFFLSGDLLQITVQEIGSISPNIANPNDQDHCTPAFLPLR